MRFNTLFQLLALQRDRSPLLDVAAGAGALGRPFGDVVAARMSRRNVLRGGALLAATGFLTAATAPLGGGWPIAVTLWLG
jgi:hypothetical protein